MAKAILLLSGGLDSTLSGKLLVQMGVEVEAVNFISPFCRCTPKSLGCPAARRSAQRLGIRVEIIPCGQAYLEAVKRPHFGRGSEANPCIDCRVHMFSQARQRMEARGADFVATGEVLGQRPMSQHRRAMALIEREAGLAGRVLRPLCARLLPPSLPERDGRIDRRRLMALSGRGRRPQFDLADELDIEDPLCPAGGCLLTDPEFAARFFDLLEHEPGFGLADARLLQTGRHFRLPSGAKAIVARDEAECRKLERSARAGDVLLLPSEVTGPSALCRRPRDSWDVRAAARLLATYTKGGTTLGVTARPADASHSVDAFPSVRPLPRETVAGWHVGSQAARHHLIACSKGGSP